MAMILANVSEQQRLKTEVGSRLRQVREQLNLSQADLARELDMEPGAIDHIERGRTFPLFPILAGLVKRRRVSADWLVSGEGEMFRGSEALPSLVGRGSGPDRPYTRLLEKMAEDDMVEKIIFGKFKELELFFKAEKRG